MLPIPTCAHHGSKDPALPKLDWPAPAVVPLGQDGDAATPLGGADAPGIVLAPVAQEDPIVIVAVDLEGGGSPMSARGPSQAKPSSQPLK